MKLDDLRKYVISQSNHLFPDGLNLTDDRHYNRAFDTTMDRMHYCFKHVNMPAYNKNGATHFSHLHSDQYTMFLWFLSNTLWKEYEDTTYAQKIFYLNRTLNSFLCMYDADLPDVFLIIHGLGTTLGKAAYSNFFVCYQGVTVGAKNGVYPQMGRGVSLLPHSSIIGNTVVEDGVSVGTNCMVFEQNVKANSVVFNATDSGVNETKKKNVPWSQKFFNVPVL